MDALWLFFVFLRASLLSLGGSGALPLLRADLVGAGIISNAQVVEAITIGRLSSGPGGLYVVSMGYVIMGWPGAILAALATAIPPLLVIPIAGLIRRWRHHRAVDGGIRGLALTTSGLAVAVSTLLLLEGRDVTGFPLLVAGAIGAGILAYDGRVHPLAILGLGGVLGLLVV